MRYTHLGRSGLSISRLCLGTMNFGRWTDEPTSHAVMDAAHDAGINFFDTANVYGQEVSLGRTEEIIGNWFASGGGRREKTVIATKLYGAADRNGRTADGSLRSTSAAPWTRASSGCRPTMSTSISSTTSIGIRRGMRSGRRWKSPCSRARCSTPVHRTSPAGISRRPRSAQPRHFVGLVSEQSIYNLMKRAIELEVIPAAESYGLGIIPWSPLQGGLLGGVLKKTVQEGRRIHRSDELERNRDAIEAYEHLAAELGHEPAELGLAWLLHQPAVTAPIVGPRTADQLTSALNALDIKLDRSVWGAWTSCSPGTRRHLRTTPGSASAREAGRGGDAVGGDGSRRGVSVLVRQFAAPAGGEQDVRRLGVGDQTGQQAGGSRRAEQRVLVKRHQRCDAGYLPDPLHGIGRQLDVGRPAQLDELARPGDGCPNDRFRPGDFCRGGRIEGGEGEADAPTPGGTGRPATSSTPRIVPCPSTQP